MLFSHSLNLADTSSSNPLAGTSRPKGKSKWVRVAIFAIVALYLLRLGPAPMYPISEDDSPSYLNGAMAIAQGNGYQLASDINHAAAIKYPVGYPLVLAGFIKVFGLNRNGVTAIRLFSLALMVVWLFMQPFLLRRYISTSAQYVIPLVIAVTPLAFQLSGQIMSEPLFCVLILFSLTMGEAAVVSKSSRRTHWTAALAGITASLCMIVRTIGFPMIAAIPISLAIKKRWGPASVALACSLIIVVPWAQWSIRHSGGTFSTYAKENSHQGIHPISQVFRIVEDCVPAVAAPPLVGKSLERLPRAFAFVLKLCIGLPLTALTIAGMFRLFIGGSLTAIATTLYVGVVLGWWWDPGRFLLPIYPMLAIGLCVGCRSLLEITHSGAFKHFSLGPVQVSLLVGVMVVGCLYTDLRKLQCVWLVGNWGGEDGKAVWSDLESLGDAVSSSTPSNAVLLSSWPDVIYLLTGRQTIPQPVESRLIEPALAETPIDHPLYIVATNRTNWMSPADEEYGIAGIAEVMGRKPGLLRLTWQPESMRVALYRVDRTNLGPTK